MLSDIQKQHRYISGTLWIVQSSKQIHRHAQPQSNSTVKNDLVTSTKLAGSDENKPGVFVSAFLWQTDVKWPSHMPIGVFDSRETSSTNSCLGIEKGCVISMDIHQKSHHAHPLIDVLSQWRKNIYYLCDRQTEAENAPSLSRDYDWKPRINATHRQTATHTHTRSRTERAQREQGCRSVWYQPVPKMSKGSGCHGNRVATDFGPYAATYRGCFSPWAFVSAASKIEEMTAEHLNVNLTQSCFFKGNKNVIS